LVAKFGADGFSAFAAALTSTDSDLDEQLVDLINAAWMADPKQLPQDFNIDKQKSVRLSAYPKLQRAPVETLRLRLNAAKHFNRLLESALPLIDLRQALIPGTLAHALSAACALVWLPTKMALWTAALASTACSGGSSVEFSLNRHTAADQIGRRGGSDRVLMATTFGQMFARINTAPPRVLRVGNGGRAWRVNFVGEGSIDAGGPYRESLSDCVAELHLPHLALFVPCANRQAEAEGFVAGLNGIHNMDKYVPNPRMTRPHHLQMYGFVGKLLGLAMRSGAALPFHFPPIVYRQVLGQPVGRTDLKLIDKFLVDYLDNVARAPLDPAMSDDLFADLYGDRCFTTKSVDGREVELKPGGRSVGLTLSNSNEFVRLMFGYHLNEFGTPCAAIARGLATQVPLNLLRVFTAGQMELLVTGRSEVDLVLLRSKTEYQSPFSEGHPTIVLFWQMMELFTHAERSLFLKFAWSRDRLPLRAADFSSNFKITRLGVSGNPNDSFPMAHTCFFTVDLPEYTSLEAMSHKVRYAMENCTAIDIDNRAGDFAHEDVAGDSTDDDA
jgi:hypothetical protein